MTNTTRDFAVETNESDTADQWQKQGWADQPTEVRVAPRLAATISVRFDAADASALKQAARLSGLSKSEFVRRAALTAALAELRKALPVAELTGLHAVNSAQTGSSNATTQSVSLAQGHRAQPVTASQRQSWHPTEQEVEAV